MTDIKSEMPLCALESSLTWTCCSVNRPPTEPTLLTFVTEVMDILIIGCVKWELPVSHTSHQIEFTLLRV